MPRYSNNRFVHSAQDAMLVASRVVSASFIESFSISATLLTRKNDTNVMWTHIAKSASSTWTKVTKSVSTWTHTNKSNQ